MSKSSLRLLIPTILVATLSASLLPLVSAQDISGEDDQDRQSRHAHHQQVKETVQNGDYTSFQELVKEDVKLGSVITNEALFNKLVEAHELKAAGDREGAKALMDELGLKPHKHGRKAFRAQFQNLSEADQAKVQEARELAQSGDKEAAKAIFEELGIKPPRRAGAHFKAQLENLSEADQARFKEARELAKSGDREAAKEVFEELGIKKPHKHKGFKRGGGFGQRGFNGPAQQGA